MNKELVSTGGIPAHMLTQMFREFSQIEGLKEVLLYGSRAKGNFRPASDIDLTLVGPDLTFRDLCRLDTRLDDLLMPYTIDLSIHHHIQSGELLDHIKRVGIVIWKREEEG